MSKFESISMVGYRIKFWLYSDPEAPFIGDCVSIFKVAEGYFLGINFDGEDDVIGINIDDVRMIKRLKKITHNYTVISMEDIKKEKQKDDGKC